MKTICFTNNDLAKAMGLEVGDEFIVKNNDAFRGKWKVVFDNIHEEGEIKAKSYMCVYQMYHFIGEEIEKLEPQPQLTEQEITILKGRLAEGCKTIYRDGLYIGFDDFITTDYVDTLFQFIKSGEEYSIEELLKGEVK
jgi:hypothetical protein